MKGEIWSRLIRAPRLKKSDWLWTLVPALLWFLATDARPRVIHTRCVNAPQACSAASLTFSVDRLALGSEDPKADEYSFDTQNLSGALAFSVPIAWNTALWLLGHASLPASLLAAGTDFVLVGQSVAWNGLFTELSHLVVQRPRPFVYSDPTVRGRDPAHYTSFYSGHTSFAAAAMTALFLVLLARGANLSVLILCGVSGQALILLTAIFRVLAGRHFVTDVIAGAFAGVLIATTVAYLHRPRGPGIA